MNQPQDHLPKKTKPKVTDVEGGKRVEFPDLPAKTKTGVAIVDEDGKPQSLTVTVALDALNDFELLDDMHALETRGNLAKLPALLHRFVGDDYDAVMSALRNEAGRVTIDAGSEFVRDLIGAINPKS